MYLIYTCCALLPVGTNKSLSHTTLKASVHLAQPFLDIANIKLSLEWKKQKRDYIHSCSGIKWKLHENSSRKIIEMWIMYIEILLLWCGGLTATSGAMVAELFLLQIASPGPMGVIVSEDDSP